MRTMRRSKYPTDLSDTEWECLKPHLPAREKRSRGRPRLHSPRQILDAVFYVLRSGCPWRLLPGDFPPWRTVYHWFRRWRIEGTFERLNAALRESLRVRSGRETQSPARVSSTASQPRLPRSVASNVGTMGARRSMAGSAISWWTRRDWCSRRRFTALRSPTRTA